MASIPYDESYCEQLRERRAWIMEHVAHAAEEAGRDPKSVTVMAVSKTVDVPEVAAARAAGWTCFGENRPQELERKLALLADDPSFADVSFHMIGNLQTNKINHVLACSPVLVHSIASPELARAVSQRAVARGMRQPVLLEVNVSGEQSKSGMSVAEVRASFDELAALPGIEVRGFMTMAPRSEPAVARATFAGLRELRDELCLTCENATKPSELSMGMSEDFEEAVAQGATIVRLGRIAFDPSFPVD
ncbi:MAG: YggS family pyridoxal phosphate-dependent enzyme [Coriobacteriia bacterium]|nr:YggS family pyridoxal phosphate-dependent enzyme [Coriobacteriia bacterium]MBS5478723.1 YggS family pyridoxal phosphate-dependent enzyme [Coriobacteriia bacterium]